MENARDLPAPPEQRNPDRVPLGSRRGGAGSNFSPPTRLLGRRGQPREDEWRGDGSIGRRACFSRWSSWRRWAAAISSIAPCPPIPASRRFPACRRRCASGATTSAFRTSSPPRWTTRRGRSATRTPASGCSRWRSCAGSARGGWPKSAAPIFSASTSSFALSACTARPRRASRRFRPGRKSASRPMPTGSTPSSMATGMRSRPSSSSPAIVPSRGSRPISLVIAKLEAYQLSQSFRLKLLRARLLEKLGPDQANWLFPTAKPGEPITTLPSLGERHAERESIDDEIGALTGIGRRRVERMGDRRIADGEREADPRQRSASRSQRADPLVSRPHRDARRLGQGRDHTRRAGLRPRPEQFDRLGLHDRGLERAGSFRRDRRSERPGEISDARRTAAVRYPRRDDPRQRGGGRQARDSLDPPRPGALGRQRGRREPRRHRERSSPSPSPDLATATRPPKPCCASTRRETGDEFLDALRLYQTPTQNLVYADVAGNIGFFSPGLVPTRKSGDGSLPVDGASGAFDWTGTIPFDQLPQLYNPAIGFAFNANNADVPPDHQPSFGFDYEETFPRPPHPAVLRYDREAQPRNVGRDAGRPSVAGRQGAQPFIAAIAPSNDYARQAAGDADEVGRRDDQGPRRAAGLHRFPRRAAQDPARGQNRAADEGKGSVRRDDAHFSSARPYVVVRLSRRSRSGLPQGARPRSRRRPRASWSSATAQT